MKELHDILNDYDNARQAQQAIRDGRIPDLTFARISQNSDEMSELCTTEFMGQFDIIGRERKNVQAEFRQNEVEVKFRHKSEDDDNIDSIVQGKYRTDRRASKSRQAFHIAQDDAMDCGMGAWRLRPEYEDSEDYLNTNLVIKREPIPEAIRCVFWDADSKLYDKSDARHCSVITEFTESGYKVWLEENGLEEDSTISFDSPMQSIYEKYWGFSMVYPLQIGKRISILEHYAIEEEGETVFIYKSVNDFGEEELKAYTKDEAERYEMGTPFRKKRIKKKICRKYVTNGTDILQSMKVAGNMIPIIMLYGERNFVEGVENFYGIVKAAKDPQKLINAGYNYLASMMMFSPTPKPMYDPRELEGHLDQHDSANQHDLAYLNINKTYTTEDGKEMPFQPQHTQAAQVPPAVAHILTALPQITDSILNPSVTEDSFNSNMSGVALQQVREQIGVMRYILLDNFVESMRYDGEVYAAMLADTYDTDSRKIVTTNVDDTTTTEVINEPYFDLDIMDTRYRNEVRGQKFNIYTDVGASHATQQEAALANLKEIFATLPDGNPMKQVVMLSILSKQKDEGLDELNKVSRFMLLDMGVAGIEPQTDEEEAYLQMKQAQAEAQGNQMPIEAQIAMMQEQTRQLQAQQGVMREQNQQMANQIKAYQAQTGAQNDQANTMIKASDSETKRMEAMVKAQETGANITNTQMDTVKKGVESQLMQADMAEKEMDLQIKNMSDEDLLRAARDL